MTSTTSPTGHITSNFSGPNVSTTTHAPRSGYDLPVYGLASGDFLKLHIPALTCIALSFVCAVTVIVTSFWLKGYRTFFSWTKGERLVVYLAICDALFNIAHTMDHAHYVATRDHIYPEELCEFYGFMLAEFISAQNLMVNVVAVNAFMLIYFKKQINFGQRDWRLLLYTFGLPCLGGIIAGAAKQFGTNGAFCFFDAIRGHYANIFFTTVPLVLVTIVNIVMYILTWRKIYQETHGLQESLGENTPGRKAAHYAAKTMMLFVAAFFIQWWAMAMYGIWQILDPTPPQLLFQFVTTYSNLGGVLNGIVYIIIRRRVILAKKERIQLTGNTVDSGKGMSLSESGGKGLDDSVTGKTYSNRQVEEKV